MPLRADIELSFDDSWGGHDWFFQIVACQDVQAVFRKKHAFTLDGRGHGLQGKAADW
jgi:hypothetical protein